MLNKVFDLVLINQSIFNNFIFFFNKLKNFLKIRKLTILKKVFFSDLGKPKKSRCFLYRRALNIKNILYLKNSKIAILTRRMASNSWIHHRLVSVWHKGFLCAQKRFKLRAYEYFSQIGNSYGVHPQLCQLLSVSIQFENFISSWK